MFRVNLPIFLFSVTIYHASLLQNNSEEDQYSILPSGPIMNVLSTLVDFFYIKLSSHSCLFVILIHQNFSTIFYIFYKCLYSSVKSDFWSLYTSKKNYRKRGKQSHSFLVIFGIYEESPCEFFTSCICYLS